MPGITTGASAAMPGLRVVLGTGREAGEFKVPLGPAPRQLHVQQANFNAQLTVSVLMCCALHPMCSVCVCVCVC